MCEAIVSLARLYYLLQYLFVGEDEGNPLLIGECFNIHNYATIHGLKITSDGKILTIGYALLTVIYYKEMILDLIKNILYMLVIILVWIRYYGK